jgi:hypothetical protein
MVCAHEWIELTELFTSGDYDYVWKDCEFIQMCTICKERRTVIRDHVHHGSKGKGSHIKTLPKGDF